MALEHFWRFCFLNARFSSSIKAHHAVLKGSSQFFKALLEDPAHPSRILVEETSFELLTKLLTFMYEGKIVVEAHNVFKMLIVASRLNVNLVRDLCTDFVKDNFRMIDANRILDAAKKSGVTQLIDLAIGFMSENFPEFEMSATYLELEEDHLLRLLDQEDLEVASEQEVFLAAIRWIDHNPDERKRWFEKLMTAVRWVAIDPKVSL